ncbi:MAG TPA: acetyl-CoA carboxylase biotin carboxyl carrier protein [Pyrinomonadaceae bacterium]|jgi:acetyl-CoA carboxylase biotin carboxyl carrier protein
MSDQDTPQPNASSDESEQAKNNRQPERTAREGREGRERSRGRRRHGGQPQHRSSEQSLNMEELRELVELISEYGFTDFELENKDVRVRLRRELAPQIVSAPPAAHIADTASAQTSATSKAAMQTATTAAPAETQAESANAATPAEHEEIHIVTAPIVGTIYRAPSPNAEPFVQIGSQVRDGQVLCIIEAMKLMNEIESDVGGVVAKIYVENGQPVEYGQPLFGVKV